MHAKNIEIRYRWVIMGLSGDGGFVGDGGAASVIVLIVLDHFW